MLIRMHEQLQKNEDPTNIIGDKLQQGASLDQYYKAVQDDPNISRDDKIKAKELYDLYRSSYSAILKTISETEDKDIKEVKSYIEMKDTRKESVLSENSHFDPKIAVQVTPERIKSDSEFCQGEVDKLQDKFQPKGEGEKDNAQAKMGNAARDIITYISGYTVDVAQLVDELKREYEQDIKKNTGKPEMKEKVNGMLKSLEALERIQIKSTDNVHNLSAKDHKVLRDVLEERVIRYGALLSTFNTPELKEQADRFGQFHKAFTARENVTQEVYTEALKQLGASSLNELSFKNVQQAFQGLDHKAAQQKMHDLIGTELSELNADKPAFVEKGGKPIFNILKVREEILGEIKSERNLYAFHQQILNKSELFRKYPQEIDRYQAYTEYQNGSKGRYEQFINQENTQLQENTQALMREQLAKIKSSTDFYQDCKKQKLKLKGKEDTINNIIIKDIYPKALLESELTKAEVDRIAELKVPLEQQIVKFLKEEIKSKKYAAKAFTDSELKQFMVNKFANPSMHEQIILILANIHDTRRGIDKQFISEYTSISNGFLKDLEKYKNNEAELSTAVAAISSFLKDDKRINPELLDILKKEGVTEKFISESIKDNDFSRKVKDVANSMGKVNSDHKREMLQKAIANPEIFGLVKEMLDKAQEAKSTRIDSKQAERFNTLYEAMKPILENVDQKDRTKAVEGLSKLVVDKTHKHELDLDQNALKAFDQDTAKKFIKAYIKDATITDRLPSSQIFGNQVKLEYFHKMIDNPKMHKHVYDIAVAGTTKVKDTLFVSKMNELYDKAVPFLEPYKNEPVKMASAKGALQSILVKSGKELVLDKDAIKLVETKPDLVSKFAEQAVQDRGLHNKIFLKIRPMVSDLETYVNIHNNMFGSIKTVKFDPQKESALIDNCIKLSTTGVISPKLDVKRLTEVATSQGSQEFLGHLSQNPQVAMIVFSALEKSGVPLKDGIRGVNIVMAILPEDVLSKNLDQRELKDFKKSVDKAISSARESNLFFNGKVKVELLDVGIHSACQDELSKKANVIFDNLANKKYSHGLDKLNRFEKVQVLHAIEYAIKDKNHGSQDLDNFLRVDLAGKKIPKEVFTTPAGMEFLSAAAEDRKVAKAVLEQCEAKGLSLEKLSPRERDQFMIKFSSLVTIVSDEIAKNTTQRQNSEFIKQVMTDLNAVRSNGQLNENIIHNGIIAKSVIESEQKAKAEAQKEADKRDAISKKYGIGSNTDKSRSK